jgi:heme oxygenase
MFLRLGLETQPHHTVADTDRLAMMEATTVADYRAALARIYGFESVVETALASLLEPAIARARSKTDWLRRDLETLGISTSELDVLPRCTVRLASSTQALGWLFVVERHTLLAGLIRRHLEQQLGTGLPTTYLAAYGETPGARFRALGEALDEHAAHEPVRPTRIVAAALEAFRCQHQWYASAPRESALQVRGTAPDRSSLSS